MNGRPTERQLQVMRQLQRASERAHRGLYPLQVARLVWPDAYRPTAARAASRCLLALVAEEWATAEQGQTGPALFVLTDEGRSAMNREISRRRFADA